MGKKQKYNRVCKYCGIQYPVSGLILDRSTMMKNRLETCRLNDKISALREKRDRYNARIRKFNRLLDGSFSERKRDRIFKRIRAIGKKHQDAVCEIRSNSWILDIRRNELFYYFVCPICKQREYIK